MPLVMTVVFSSLSKFVSMIYNVLPPKKPEIEDVKTGLQVNVVVKRVESTRF